LGSSRKTLRLGGKYGTLSPSSSVKASIVVILQIGDDKDAEEGEEAAADGNGSVDALDSSLWRILSAIFSWRSTRFCTNKKKKKNLVINQLTINHLFKYLPITAFNELSI
jgi:hypothetical protein